MPRPLGSPLRAGLDFLNSFPAAAAFAYSFCLDVLSRTTFGFSCRAKHLTCPFFVAGLRLRFAPRLWLSDHFISSCMTLLWVAGCASPNAQNARQHNKRAVCGSWFALLLFGSLVRTGSRAYAGLHDALCTSAGSRFAGWISLDRAASCGAGTPAAFRLVYHRGRRLPFNNNKTCCAFAVAAVAFARAPTAC